MCVLREPLGPGCAAARRRPTRWMMCFARSLPATAAPAELCKKGVASCLRAAASASSGWVRNNSLVAAMVAGPGGGAPSPRSSCAADRRQFPRTFAQAASKVCSSEVVILLAALRSASSASLASHATLRATASVCQAPCSARMMRSR